MIKKTALFPGSFDPFTLAHEQLVHQALLVFDHIIIAIGQNTQKQNTFSLQQRLDWIAAVFAQDARVSVLSYTHTTVSCAQKTGATAIIRGLRNTQDFLYEQQLQWVNQQIDPHIITVYYALTGEHSFISASAVRELYLHKQSVNHLVPAPIAQSLEV